MLLLSVSALSLGFVHGLGADHLMAIAAMAVNGRGARRDAHVVRTAFGFALGHTVVLALGASIAVLFGVIVPAAVESGAESLGGVLLIALGALGLWTVASGRAYSHVHVERLGRPSWHIHLSADARHPHGHSSVPTLMGAVFAVSSLRMLMLLQPFGASAQALALPTLLLLIMLFGIGILGSMSLFGVVLARLLKIAAIEAVGKVSAIIVAVASMALGIYWLTA
jgi:hypothetical protein